MYILSQILIAFSDLVYVLSMLCKKKSGVVIFLFFSGLFFASHYFCLNEITASLITIIDSIFLLILFFLEKYKKEKFVPYLIVSTMIVCIVTSALTWTNLLSILPLVGMFIYLISMFFTNVTIIKSCSVVRVILNMTHMLLIASYVGAGLSLILLTSSIVGIILDLKNKKNLTKNDIDAKTEQN